MKKTIKNTIKNTLGVIGIITAIILLGWLFTTNNLAMFKFFAPKYEQARRETFEESKSYREGTIKELQNMQFQYEQAAPEHKAALTAIILRRAADFKDLPSDLRLFINQLKNANRNY